jgi:hypothetical protein
LRDFASQKVDRYARNLEEFESKMIGGKTNDSDPHLNQNFKLQDAFATSDQTGKAGRVRETSVRSNRQIGSEIK